jgi:hypothetical protein
MSWIILGPYLVGVIGLITTAFVLALGYRRLPRRIPSNLNISTVATTDRRRLSALAAAGDGHELTIPKTLLLLWFGVALMLTTSHLGRWSSITHVWALFSAMLTAVYCPLLAVWTAVLVRNVGPKYRAGDDVVAPEVARRLAYVMGAAVVIAALYTAFALWTLR